MNNINDLLKDPFSPYKVFKYYDDFKKLSEGSDILPKMAELDLCDYCNHQCIFCIYKNVQDCSNSLIYDKFEYIVSQFIKVGIKSVVIKGGGEPSIYPHFADVLNTLKKNDIKVGVISNGSNLCGKNAYMVADCCEWIRISIDAADKNTHELIHNPTVELYDFKNIMANVDEIITLRHKKKTPLVVGFNYIVCKENYTQIEEIIALAKLHKVDYVSFRNEMCIREYSELEKEQIHKAFKYIQTLNETELKIYSKFSGFSSFQTRKWNKCIAPSLIAIIQANGDIVSCCDSRGISKHVIGNIYQESFYDIWKGNNRNSSRHNFITPECSAICTNRYDYYNEIINYMMGEVATHESFI